MALISLQTQPFQMWGRKKKKHTCVKTHLGDFLLSSKWWKTIQNHFPRIQVVPSTCTIFWGNAEWWEFLLYRSTAFQCHGYQSICGLHLIKPGLCITGERATSMFLRLFQGAMHKGPCVWSSFPVMKKPHIILSFSGTFKLARETNKHWTPATLVAWSWGNWVCSGER